MDLKNILGFGVAGNFAGHLEQANEASDFKNIEVSEVNQPKAIFPFYIPEKENSFLNVFPFSSDQINMPDTDYDVQIEPEVALLCNVEYSEGKISSLIPKSFAAYNDCSIRRPGAKKISEKKNWGECSKGLSNCFIAIDEFSKGGILDHYRIASFHIRDEKVNIYGEDSAVKSYSYLYEKLINWSIDKFNNQADIGPAENISEYIAEAGCPSQFIIGIGATRYTDYGENNFLSRGDTSVVVLYDERVYSSQDIAVKVEKRDFNGESLSFLVQEVK
ncbi:hypothetical protein BIY24_04490 [Halobacteriovorax marinus]|uniref:DUF5718 family protein n=1 Tax=Halobacteriovorax marinus TaxID=97084 RepID=UPI000BC3483F|nr:DUF5718 family protein [Halobacteriovorax marinus]ATH07218.1 hypothetical protein BIY24_04490 [Halobacteriovorax marinus]